VYKVIIDTNYIFLCAI